MSVFCRILKQRNFWPLFGAQALGAFNDNFFRAALIAYVAFAPMDGSNKTIIGALATGLMMLPFFLFSSVAGELADKMRKSQLVKATKISELAIMILAAVFFVLGHINALLAMLFLMGAQSTFFGPLKYGLLPEVLKEEDLVGGNGLVEAATYLAIVLGTLAGSWLVTRPGGTSVYMPVGLIAVAVAGLALALRQPNSLDGEAGLKVNPKIWESTWQIVGSLKNRRDMWLAVLAISWFWAMGSILLTQIPVLCSTIMGGTSGVNTFLVTLFAAGVGLGALSAQWALGGQISARLVPASAAFLSLFLVLIAVCVWLLPAKPFGDVSPVTLDIFLNNWVYLRLGLCCLLVSVTGGLFAVPLNALLQHLAEPHERSRVIAANNIINALFICLGNAVVIIMTKAGFGLHHVFVFVALTGLVVTLLTMYFLPDHSIRNITAILLKIIYRPKVSGLEHIRNLGDGPALIVANHTSFLDVPFLVAYIPRRLTFAIDAYWAKTWWLRPLLRVFKALPVNPNQPLATRGLIDALNNGELVVIFPEGRITDTGGLMKIYEGSGLIAAKSKAPLVPVIFDGLQYSRFSRLGPILKHKPKVQAKMTVMAPRSLEVASIPGEKQKDQRRRSGEALLKMMVECLFQSMDHNRNLWKALNQTAGKCGPGRLILEDIERKPLTYRGLITKAKVLGHRLTTMTAPGENVGLLLPNSVGAVVSMFGLWAGGRVPVMLNFSQGAGPMTSAIETAQIKTILTSRRFLEATGMQEMADSLPGRLVYLDEMKFPIGDKLSALFWKATPASPDTPAVLVFTSGSEGKPKGVALSHKNVLANVFQMKSQVQINEDDVLFNALPMFHAFGLTVGVMVPLFTGMRCFNYVSPLHTKIIPELIYDTRATMTCASDTFAAAWGKSAHHYDFATLRIMLVGAEKLKPKTRALYAEKFGLRIFEGYGASETTPVLAVNNFLNCRAGSVGPILPGIEARLDPVEGVDRGGRLVVKGPNVMLGYIWPDNPGVIAPPEGGWYDTGDIVEIDEDGFVLIKGRFKRFAKIAGEMVSLVAIEEVAATLWPGRPQVLIAMDDENKGEKLVLVTEDPNPDLQRLWLALKEAGQPELSYPRQFIYLPEIPMTPLGKVNMPKVIEAAHAAAAAALETK